MTRALRSACTLLSACAIVAVLLIAAGLFQRARSTQADIIPGEYSMEVEVAPTAVATNDVFLAQLSIDHEVATGYQGAQWWLDYDESLVDVLSITRNPASPPDCSQKGDNGNRVLTACFMPFVPQGLTYSGPAFDIVFRCLVEGTANFTLIEEIAGIDRTFVARDASVNEPRHVHNDTVECSDTAPTSTPTAPSLTPTATPITGPKGGVWQLGVDGPQQVDVGEPFPVTLNIEPAASDGYRSVQWAIAFDGTELDAVSAVRASAAPLACNAIAPSLTLFGCLTDATNGLSLSGAGFIVTFVCLKAGATDIVLLPDGGSPQSLVATGEFGNSFEEVIAVEGLSVNCVEPLQYNGLVKSVDGEAPAEGEDEILRNLWICSDHATDGIDNDGNSTADDEDETCTNNGEGELIIDELVFAEQDCDTRNDDDDGDGKPVSNDPNSPGYRPECPSPTLEDYIQNWVDKDGGELPEGLGAVEFRLLFDHKVFDIAIYESDANEDGIDNDGDTEIDEADEDWANGRFPNCGMTIVTENFIMYGCVSTGTGLGHPRPNGIPVARIEVVPEPDLGFRIRPGKDNGVVRKLLDQNCQVADIYGDIFPVTNAGLTRDCTDVDVTVRRLEGDLDGDCEVTIVDAQRAAFRYGAFFGQLLYDTFYDLEPFVTPDFDLDIKDMQFVFGRVGATCADPIPNNQHPVPAMGVGQP